MKFLLKDENIAKFRKLHKALWYLILALSFFIRDSYIILQDSKFSAQEYMKVLNAENMFSFNQTAVVVMLCIFMPLLYTLMAEIIMTFCYNVIARRFIMAINKEDFTFRTRLILIMGNIIIGVFASIYYFVPQSISIVSAIINFAVPVLLFVWFYEAFRVKYIPRVNHYNLMNFIAKIYLGVVVTFSAISFIYLMFMTDLPKTNLDIIAYSIDLFVKLLFVLLAYLYGKKLKKQSLAPEDNALFIAKEKPSVHNNVFKDFNF